MEISLSEPDLTDSDSFHPGYIVFLSWQRAPISHFPPARSKVELKKKNQPLQFSPKQVEVKCIYTLLGWLSLQMWVVRNIKLIHFWLTKAMLSFGKFNLLTKWVRLFKGISELMIHTTRCKVPGSSKWLGPLKSWLAIGSHPSARVEGDWNEPLWKSNIHMC